MVSLASLGKYQLLNHLGSGAYADVYQATDTALKRTVALKVLKPALLADQEAFQRFIQEAQTAASLFHPHIAMVLDLGEDGGRYYIAMRYVDGSSLDKLLSEKGPLPLRDAFRMIQQVGEALQYAHDQGLVHRDVKPQNIIVSPTAGAVLTDFGLVKAMEASGMSTRTGAIIGTPQYIPPEVWRDKPVGPAADQYALACVLVEALTGQVLFGASTPPAIMARHFDTLVLPEKWSEGTPLEINPVIRKALAREPGERYVSMREFIQEINKISLMAVTTDISKSAVEVQTPLLHPLPTIEQTQPVIQSKPEPAVTLHLPPATELKPYSHQLTLYGKSSEENPNWFLRDYPAWLTVDHSGRLQGTPPENSTGKRTLVVVCGSIEIMADIVVLPALVEKNEAVSTFWIGTGYVLLSITVVLISIALVLLIS